MNFDNLVGDNIGSAHLLFSILALLMGTIVLVKDKGTLSHKRAGYLYTFSMLGLIITAFMIYRLFGKFGIFHWLSILSLVTLLGGIVPMLLKKPKHYISLHLSFMYWSVIGLYAAACAETLVRIPQVVIESGLPNSIFYNSVGVAVFITMCIEIYGFQKKKKNWEKFDKSIS